MRAIIGIFPNVDNDGKSSIPKTYVEAIESSGGMSILLPYTEDEEIMKHFISVCDGFLFTGGADIDPCHYGEKKSDLCADILPLRDKMELFGFSLALDSQKPILAICRGCQLVNVALGGSLYQDIGSEYKTDLAHKSEKGNYSHAHGVKISKDSPLYEIIGQTYIQVNTMHHQAIKKLGRGLIAEAAADDGIIEAVCLPGERFLHAFQWHPERTLDDDYSHKLFDAFVAAAANKKQKTEQKQ